MLHSSSQTARPCVLARLQLSTKLACCLLIKACLLDAELDAGLEPMFQCDLKSNASWIAADSQSVAICAMHRSTDSWVTSFSLLPQPSHSWGHFLPELRAGLAQLPGFPVHKLVAAQDGIVDKVSSLGIAMNHIRSMLYRGKPSQKQPTALTSQHSMLLLKPAPATCAASDMCGLCSYTQLGHCHASWQGAPKDMVRALLLCTYDGCSLRE